MQIFLLPVLLLAAQTWTVDDDGPADFASISDAIASPSVAEGDVLLVSPGGYAGFVLDKALSIVSTADSTFLASSCVVQGVSDFRIAGLSTRELLVQDVTGRGVLDGIKVGWQFFDAASGELFYRGRAQILDCDEILLTRSELHGSDACYPDILENHAGLEVVGSTVAIVQCEIQGGNESWLLRLPPGLREQGGCPCVGQPPDRGRVDGAGRSGLLRH